MKSLFKYKFLNLVERYERSHLFHLLNRDGAEAVLEIHKGVHTVHLIESMDQVSEVLVTHIVAREDEFVCFAWHGI